MTHRQKDNDEKERTKKQVSYEKKSVPEILSGPMQELKEIINDEQK